MSDTPVFTICTPLYNEGAAVERLYRCLEAQSSREFEWIVVDDGSSDDGLRQVEELGEAAPFPIRIIRKKKHCGAHAAINRAVEAAYAPFFLVLRSDEELLPETIERLKARWETIPPSERPYFSSVTGLSSRPDGSIRGDKFPAEVFDSTNFEAGGRYGIAGRKWGFQKTEVLKEFSFPEEEGETYCPDELVLNRIGGRFLTRYVNEAFIICHSDERDRAKLPIEKAIEGPSSSALFFKEQLLLPIPLARKIRAAFSYIRLSLHAGKTPDEAYQAAPRKLFLFFVLPFAFLSYRRDKKRGIGG